MNSALIIIGMQNDFVRKESALCVPPRKEMVPIQPKPLKCNHSYFSYLFENSEKFDSWRGVRMGKQGERFFLKDVHVGKRGQIVIPKDIRDLFAIKAGDHLVLVGRGARGLAIMRADQIEKFAKTIMNDVKRIKGKKSS